MLIAFVHSGQSFMPEINAYVNYFTSKNISCIVTSKEKVSSIKRDVEWFFLGADHSKLQKNVLRIHEYTSTSTPPLASIKNFLKTEFSTKPHYRIFLNSFVQKKLGFMDNIPFGLRDMGISEKWLTSTETTIEKKNDFIYIGETSAKRKIDTLLMPFAGGKLRDRNILIVSKKYEALQKQFSKFPNIKFEGPVKHDDIKNLLLASRYAINYIPNQEPFNKQTSTKFLEYAATRTPIVSTEYEWLSEFKKKFGGNYFYLKPDLSNLNWGAVNDFNYSFPDLSEWTWEKQITQSGVLDFLKLKLPGAFS
ncbi:MAG: hypothetical protein QM726_20675 [Chitinophagaceae bacterium]